MLSSRWKAGQLSRCGHDCAEKLLIEKPSAHIYVRKALDLGCKDGNSGNRPELVWLAYGVYASYTLHLQAIGP